jgi:hypothetical protein
MYVCKLNVTIYGADLVNATTSHVLVVFVLDWFFLLCLLV